MKYKYVIIYMLLLCWSAVFAVRVGAAVVCDQYCTLPFAGEYCDNSVYATDCYSLPFVNGDNDNTSVYNFAGVPFSHQASLDTAFRGVKSVICRSENMRAQQTVKVNHLHSHINKRPPAQSI